MAPNVACVFHSSLLTPLTACQSRRHLGPRSLRSFRLQPGSHILPQLRAARLPCWFFLCRRKGSKDLQEEDRRPGKERPQEHTGSSLLCCIRRRSSQRRFQWSCDKDQPLRYRQSYSRPPTFFGPTPACSIYLTTTKHSRQWKDPESSKSKHHQHRSLGSRRSACPRRPQVHGHHRGSNRSARSIHQNLPRADKGHRRRRCRTQIKRTATTPTSPRQDRRVITSEHWKLEERAATCSSAITTDCSWWYRPPTESIAVTTAAHDKQLQGSSPTARCRKICKPRHSPESCEGELYGIERTSTAAEACKGSRR